MGILDVIKKLDVDVITKENKSLIEIKEWIDTGNYALNALISGDPYKGIPNNKIIQFAGQASTGKSFMVQEIAKNAQKFGYTVVYLDSEGAYDFNLLVERGFDEDKLVYVPVTTVEQLRKIVTQIVMDFDPESGEKVLILVDSLGNLSTEKEISDVLGDKEKADLTRARLLKSFFRMIATPAAMKGIPILLVNHTYTSIGTFIPMQITSGGSGQLYNSSVIIEFTKKKDRESSGEQIGVIITGKILKSRFVREGISVNFSINFSKGLNRYSGLLELAEKFGIIRKEKRSFVLPDGQKITAKKMDKEFFRKLLEDYGLREKILESWPLKIEGNFDSDTFVDETEVLEE